MGARYTLKIVTDFAAAHTLRDYPGACSRMHGHNWKIEVEVTASALDAVGMGIDFKEVRKAARTVAERLDHQYLNEISPFDKLNPTAENIAAYLFRSIAGEINDDRVALKAITLWETERACVHYTEDN